MERKTQVYKEIASLVDAYHRCVARPTEFDTWILKHKETILSLVKEYMPSGSGIDGGTKIDLEKSTGEKLVFHFSFHHMDENGMYDGWTEHTLTVRASLIHGINLHISGRDKNHIKEYLYDVYHYDLTQEITIQLGEN